MTSFILCVRRTNKKFPPLNVTRRRREWASKTNDLRPLSETCSTLPSNAAARSPDRAESAPSRATVDASRRVVVMAVFGFARRSITHSRSAASKAFALDQRQTARRSQSACRFCARQPAGRARRASFISGH